MTDNSTLAGFEERRLAELQSYIVAKAGKKPRRRWFMALAVAATAATVTAITVVAVSSQESAYGVTRNDDGIVLVTVRDFTDIPGLTRQLKSLGVPAIVDLVPDGQMCRQEPRGEFVEDVPRGLYHAPRSIPGEEGSPGWQMRINPKLFRPGETFVWTITPLPGGGSSTSTILMKDPVAPCELVPDTRPKPQEPEPLFSATRKGGPLEGVEVVAKRVSDVQPELDRRGLKVKYTLLEPSPGNPGGGIVDEIGQDAVGKDWVVWEAHERKSAPGVVELTVTKEWYDNNPLCGGPCD